MYRVVWKFLSIFPNVKNIEELKETLLEALEVKGDNGKNTFNSEYLKELTVVLKD
ncbi:hypothetical protein KKC13_03665 [bacterium]|nr:hypothetical protein [bacterium]MBU1957894.1 hypothetical protein [bacterium]